MTVRNIVTFARVAPIAFALSLGTSLPSAAVSPAAGTDVIELASAAFVHGGDIPRRCTCDGGDVSPSLAWKDIPVNVKSLALIVDDPDVPDPAAPRRTWVHWVLYDIPPAADGLSEAATPATLPAGTRNGKNDWGKTGYGGPCPPIGTHRYFFKLYALDTALGDLGEPSAARLEEAMKGHVVAVTELVGRYRRAD